MHYVYVLRSSRDLQNYVGCTKDITKRIALHNSGKVLSTRNRLPLKLIYCEIYLNQQDAYAREKFLKSGWGKNYLKRALKNFLTSKVSRR